VTLQEADLDLVAWLDEMREAGKMSDYPNREHQNADAAARRRALAALDHMVNEAEILRQRIERRQADGDDTQRIANLARDITQHVSILGVLREVREWHAIDQTETRP